MRFLKLMLPYCDDFNGKRFPGIWMRAGFARLVPCGTEVMFVDRRSARIEPYAWRSIAARSRFAFPAAPQVDGRPRLAGAL